MEARAVYTLTPPIETAFKALALKASAAIGYTLTEQQVRDLAYELATELPSTPAATAALAAGFCAGLGYDLENEHPVHTWGRWAHAVKNDETLPGETYGDFVESRRHVGQVGVSGQQFTADAPTLASLEAMFSKKTDRLKSHITQEYFDSFVRGRIAEGRMKAVGA